jgi:hypothetical protein
LDKFRKWFNDYASGFYGDDVFINANIELKHKHSNRTCGETRYLLKKLGIDEYQGFIAQAIALFHDLGRFEQFTKFRTYNDGKSISHSKLAMEILEREKVLDDLDAFEKQVIMTAIQYHTEKELPVSIPENVMVFCKLIRDADKLDIYRVVTEGYKQYHEDPENFRYEIEFPDSEGYNSEIAETVLKGERVNYGLIRNFNDIKLCELAWVYDINFKASFERIKAKRYLQQIIKYLPVDEGIKQIEKKVLDYVDDKINSDKSSFNNMP